MPGLPPPDTLARTLSKSAPAWKSVGGPDRLFLATRFAGVAAFEAFEERLDQDVGSGRVQTTFHSVVCDQTTHQQTLRGRPVVGARFRTVSSPAASVVLGGPVADLEQDPQDRYKVGAAWAALLWDFRTSVGPGIADAIAFHSLQFLEPRCTYETARQALHHADLALFPARRSGRHKVEIDEVFDGRMG